MIRRRRWLHLATALAAAPGVGRTQPRFPERPITLLVPFGPGGIADLTARMVGEAMSRKLGQPLVVDNRPSAGSIAASQAVAAARPDGHTLLLMTNAHAVAPALFKRLPFDATRDFEPVGTLAFFDIGVFAAAGSRFATLTDALAAARTQPGRVVVGTVAVGSTQHLAARLFESLAGVQLLRVPYKSSPALLTALRAGEVDLAFEVLGPMLPQVASGAVRALAVAAPQRHPALPQAPTAAQAGVDGFEVASWNALAAPAGTPPPVIERLRMAALEAASTAAVRERAESLGIRLVVGTPAELRALLARETRRWGEVARAAGIEPQ